MGKNVIISVFDKSNLDVIAKFLVNKKFTIYSTGGTSKFLKKINVPHKEITKYTKQKESRKFNRVCKQVIFWYITYSA